MITPHEKLQSLRRAQRADEVFDYIWLGLAIVGSIAIVGFVVATLAIGLK